ncbi:MAG: YtxH domain-containing protein [Culicoidibacterales bacterium]
MANKGKFLFGAVLGAAAGAVAGVLLAPKSGKETRENLAEKAEELKTMTPDEIKEKALEKAEELKEKALEKAEELKEKAAISLDGAKDHLEHIDFNDVRQSMEEKRAEIANKIKQSAENLGETQTVEELASTSPVVKPISDTVETVVEPVQEVEDVTEEGSNEVVESTEEVATDVPSEEDLRETLTKKVNEFKTRVGQAE